MKTVNELIAEKISDTSIRKRLASEDRTIAVYRAHPQLENIDNKLLELRKEKMLAAIDHDDKPIPAMIVRENELISLREKYISSHGIDPEFDEEKVVCKTCKDTGYSKTRTGSRIVCPDCMSDMLKEAYEEAGMADYATYTLKSFDLDHFKNKKERRKKFEAIKALFEDEKREGSSVALYCDSPRTGKTFISIILVKYAIIESRNAVYLRAEDLEDMSERKVSEIKGCDFVVIDDYSAESTLNRRIALALNSILEARSARSLPTLVVSSAPAEMVIKDSDARISGKLINAVRI